MADDNVLEVLGHQINLKNVTNPALRRVIGNRLKTDEFMFSFLKRKVHTDSDYSDHSERYSDHTDHTQTYDDHTEHYDDYKDTCREYSCD